LVEDLKLSAAWQWAALSFAGLRWMVQTAFAPGDGSRILIGWRAGDSMKSSGTGRALAAVFLGVMFGIYRHFLQMRQLAEGRTSFLASESHYFDRITQTHSLGLMLIAGVILAAIAIVLYEVIAAGFTKMIPPSQVEE
jgi:hypothetical protein